MMIIKSWIQYTTTTTLSLIQVLHCV